MSSVQIRAPNPKPTRVVCMAVNYNDGMANSRGADAFHKSPDAIIGDGDTMVLGDVPASVFEGEAELAVVIGKKGRNVASGDARATSSATPTSSTARPAACPSPASSA